MIFNDSIDILTLPERIKILIDEFQASTERSLMLKGERYYKTDNDILKRKMYRYENEQKVVDETKPNHRYAHGFMHLLVEDKVNYLLSKPYSLTCDNEKYLDIVEKNLGKNFQRKLPRLGVEASNKGISWLHVYIDSKGLFRTLIIPSEQIIPLWVDNEREELAALIRYHEVEYYEGKQKKYETKIEYWTPESVDYFVMRNGEVMLDSEEYLTDDHAGHFLAGGSPESWGAVPFIPFKNNDFELPDLKFVETLIDGYDISRSDIANLLDEIKSVIYALKGYGGENLSEFMRDLAYYRAVKLDEDGGMDTHNPTIDIQAAKEHYDTLRKDIYDFGQGVDKNSDKLGNSPSGIALKFIYSGLDLKCNALESWFSWAFSQLQLFIDRYLEVTKQGVFTDEVEIVFNRDIAINESQAIADAVSSKGVISDETIVANHPWVKDVEEEMKRLNTIEIADPLPKE